MAIKVTFPAGSNTVTVSGLYQWDYGQVLEIESADLSTLVEVHFACPNMKEAIVRVCSVLDGVATVTVPDQCLEQAVSSITAWVYEYSDDGTQGRTTKTIYLPLVSRTRPSITKDIPSEVSDKYTELITEVNEVIGALQSGEVTVAKATDATNAGYATSAGNASTSDYAISAGNANRATSSGYEVIYKPGVSTASVSVPMGNNIYLVRIAGVTISTEDDQFVEIFMFPIISTITHMDI